MWAEILSMLVRDLQPILVYTTDEVLSFMPEGLRDGQQFAALLDWYVAPLDQSQREGLEDAYNAMLDARAAFTKAYEDAVAADLLAEKSTQAARVVLSLPADQLEQLSGLGVDLAEAFVCSEVELEQGDEVAATVFPARGEKCPRCWNYRELGEDGLCARCHDAVAEHEHDHKE